MAIYAWNGADERLIDSIVESEELRKRLPRLDSFYEGVQEMKGWLGDNSFEGRFTNSRGWTKGRHMKRIASIPYSVAAAIKEVNPNAFKDRAWTMAFLAKHPEYSVEDKG